MTILFLDVNSALRGERTFALQQHPGWEVVAVGSLIEARAWLAKTQELDLLITEAIIDESTTGFELRDAALSRFPEARILFTTRYDLSGYEAQVAGWLVLKDAPYTIEKLLSKIQQALECPLPVTQSSLPAPHLSSGTMLGNYQVLERLTLENESETYRAIQVTVQRPVALVLMRPELVQNPEAVANFKSRERLKASISHPRIAPLYEAREVNGLIFYTRELPRGRSLDEIQMAGETLSERKVAELLYGVGEAMQYAIEKGCHHRRLAERDVFLDAENQASIVNIFRPGDSRTRDPKEEVAALIRLITPLAAEGKARGLLTSLSAESHDWSGLLDALDDIREAMRDRSIMRRIEAEEISPRGGGSRASWWLWAGAAVALFTVFGLGNFVGTVTPVTSRKAVAAQTMIAIPAGPFLYQKRERRSLPTFWISRDEVTIGQYADFLRALEAVPQPSAYDHPDQPKTKTSHTPPKWADTYIAAKAGATFNSEPISLNTPVTMVDWWDAYAYARWKGQRLPTEEEWEKAARGENGLSFPWGDASSREKANLGDDYDANGRKGGSKDQFNLWAPTDRECQDVSPYGIHDMAGNVSEWTASEFKGEPWPAHPDFPDLRVPVVRGGHFALKSSNDLLTARFFAESANEITLARGFRTASDQAP